MALLPAPRAARGLDGPDQSAQPTAGQRPWGWFPLAWIIAALIGAGLVIQAGPRLWATVGGSKNGQSMPTGLSSPEGPVPTAIQATIHRGPIAIALTVAPVDVGLAHVHVSITMAGRPFHPGLVRAVLAMPAQPTIGATTLAMIPCDGDLCGQGQLQALGRWRLDIIIVPPDHPRDRLSIPFDFMNGANARFLFAQPPDTRFGPAAVTLTRIPQGASTLRVHLRPRLTVRGVVEMPNMLSMGTAVYAARPQPGGWYAISLAFPMTGVTQITLQVQTPHRWYPVRTLDYDVDSAGNAALITNTPS